MSSVAVQESPPADSASAEIASCCATARRVIGVEVEGLQALAASLDQSFDSVVDLVIRLKGRVVLTGIGKSGLVARKIAATLASTGTLAYFVHPGEASHGDLGMISRDDVVIALSNSGETPELRDIVHYCRRYAIPLVAMTGRRPSALADTATHVLLLPTAPEACAIGMAPTTSTTMMMTLGDALAVAVMELRGFSRDHFREFHPGGRLGQSLLKVSKIMHGGSALPAVRPDTPMGEVILEISAKGFGCAAVVRDGMQLVGTITDGDLRRHMADHLLRLPAAEVMSLHPKSVSPDTLVGEAMAVINRHKITSLFVVENERLIGILHVHDCLRAGAA